MNLKFRIANYGLFVLLIFGFGFSVSAVEPNDANTNSSYSPGYSPATGVFMKDAKAFPKIFLEDTKKTYFNSGNLMLLLMAGGGSIALHDRADEKIGNHFEEHRSLPKDLDNFTDMAGNPGIHFAATGIWYWAASSKKDDLNMQRSWIMFRALAVTGATTLMLKGIANNHSPNGASLAWPSGHTSSSFTVAAVLDEFYGPKIGIPAYLAAGFVGYRMMDSGDHWASDVLFGGVLGYVVGHAIAGENKNFNIAGFKIAPFTPTLGDRPAPGIALAKEF
ncbi:MAG: phosphatase PAP2 family protein [Phycisphaerae bacterium]|jgi:hypothetical protein